MTVIAVSPDVSHHLRCCTASVAFKIHICFCPLPRDFIREQSVLSDLLIRDLGFSVNSVVRSVSARTFTDEHGFLLFPSRRLLRRIRISCGRCHICIYSKHTIVWTSPYCHIRWKSTTKIELVFPRITVYPAICDIGINRYMAVEIDKKKTGLHCTVPLLFPYQSWFVLIFLLLYYSRLPALLWRMQ